MPFEEAGPTTTLHVTTVAGVLPDLILSVVPAVPDFVTTAPSPSQFNPAKAGSVVVLYAFGCGSYVQPLFDGEITQPGLAPSLTPPIRVLLGDQSATVLYAGYAPGLVAGVTQTNVQVPQSLSQGVTPALFPSRSAMPEVKSARSGRNSKSLRAQGTPLASAQISRPTLRIQLWIAPTR